MMQTRREFLIVGAKALGCWLVGLSVACRIVRLAREREAPYLVEVLRPEACLWASRQGENYVLGNNSCLVLALGGLQQRLLQLGENVEIQVDRCGL